MIDECYILKEPEVQTTSMVFNSPHSGRSYSESFLKNSLLKKPEIRASEDAYVDDLFSSVTEFGAPLLTAVAPRAFVDLNRQADELDSAIIQGVNKNILNSRVLSGLGVIPRIVSKGNNIQSGKMTIEQANLRLDKSYFPYHYKLKKLLDQTKLEFGKVILIDCHSMPMRSTHSLRSSDGKSPNIVLGNRFGSSCSSDIMEQIKSSFEDAGFRVSQNIPFSGAYILKNYGRPSINEHAVQIEIDRGLYLNEKLVEKSDKYYDLEYKLKTVIRDIVSIGK
uniref:N-formylglutamate amidohydrolase n=1 Tax=uncultured alpha proteobacterium EB080_L27A02 TaxID=710796 RepID=E0Y112_9PROT|nr:N-formylglutamate amidohydrolase [uncultured alpha proteobacterium EB080_L27A02]